jgi:hypothetical protein
VTCRPRAIPRDSREDSYRTYGRALFTCVLEACAHESDVANAIANCQSVAVRNGAKLQPVVGMERACASAVDRLQRREWTKENIKEIKAHSKAKTPVDKISKITKRSVGSLRQKALSLGIGLGHQR